MAEVEHVKNHKEELERQKKEIERELKLIEEFKLETRHDMQPNHQFTMFDAVRNRFFDICGYDFEEEKVILFVYELNTDYVYYEDVEMWDASYMEVSFKEYKKEYLPLFNNKEKGEAYLKEVKETKERNEMEEV